VIRTGAYRLGERQRGTKDGAGMIIKRGKTLFFRCGRQPACAEIHNPHSAAAEREREMISKRTKEALAAAKARGQKLGGPKWREAGRIGAETNRRLADSFAANMLSIIRELENTGITTLLVQTQTLTLRGTKTVRGGAWSPQHVANVMRRAAP
jgi:hypothetical protein